MTTLTIAAQQALKALRQFTYEGNPAITALKAALAQEQAEPDHETRAELAEQHVVQLAEERDHYRNLWQQAQEQAEPRNQCGETCERAKLCAVCARELSNE